MPRSWSPLVDAGPFDVVEAQLFAEIDRVQQGETLGVVTLDAHLDLATNAERRHDLADDQVARILVARRR
jgi:arginase family enzyme